MSLGSWRIVFFGTPSFAVPSLKALIKGPDQVVGVVTQPDREKGRGRKVIFSPIKELTLQYGLNLFQPEKLKEEKFQNEIRKLEPDLIIVVAFGQILPPSLLNLPKYGAVNVHASLLPKYRGAAPIAWAILNGEEVTGVTTMKMDEGLDTGDILLQEEVFIGERETTESLQNRLADIGGQLLVKTLVKMKTGEIQPVPQDHSKATYAPSLKKGDGTIDWKKSALEIDRQVRAFHPWPGTFTKWNNHLLRIYQGEVRQRKSTGRGGTVVWVGLDSIEVETGENSYIIKEVQLEGKRRMSTREFLSGHPITVGTVFQ